MQLPSQAPHRLLQHRIVFPSFASNAYIYVRLASLPKQQEMLQHSLTQGLKLDIPYLIRIPSYAHTDVLGYSQVAYANGYVADVQPYSLTVSPNAASDMFSPVRINIANKPDLCFIQTIFGFFDPSHVTLPQWPFCITPRSYGKGALGYSVPPLIQRTTALTANSFSSPYPLVAPEVDNTALISTSILQYLGDTFENLFFFFRATGSSLQCANRDVYWNCHGGVKNTPEGTPGYRSVVQLVNSSLSTNAQFSSPGYLFHNQPWSSTFTPDVRAPPTSHYIMIPLEYAQNRVYLTLNWYYNNEPLSNTNLSKYAHDIAQPLIYAPRYLADGLTPVSENTAVTANEAANIRRWNLMTGYSLLNVDPGLLSVPGNLLPSLLDSLPGHYFWGTTSLTQLITMVYTRSYLLSPHGLKQLN